MLSEQLPDLSVNVAKEVHVGGSTVQAFVLHQELTEQHLRFVFLPHDLELRGEPRGNKCDPVPQLLKFTFILQHELNLADKYLRFLFVFV